VLGAALTAIFIDGVAPPMATRQMRLRDRYFDPTEKAPPKADDR
jgi:hypothetical protein